MPCVSTKPQTLVLHRDKHGHLLSWERATVMPEGFEKRKRKLVKAAYSNKRNHQWQRRIYKLLLLCPQPQSHGPVNACVCQASSIVCHSLGRRSFGWNIREYSVHDPAWVSLPPLHNMWIWFLFVSGFVPIKPCFAEAQLSQIVWYMMEVIFMNNLHFSGYKGVWALCNTGASSH